MSLIQVSWPCEHAKVDEICWQCTAEVSHRRVENLRLHLQFIRDGKYESAQKIASHGLAEDERFLDCAAEKHSFLDATTFGEPDPPRLLPCAVCGAKPPKRSAYGC